MSKVDNISYQPSLIRDSRSFKLFSLFHRPSVQNVTLSLFSIGCLFNLKNSRKQTRHLRHRDLAEKAQTRCSEDRRRAQQKEDGQADRHGNERISLHTRSVEKLMPGPRGSFNSALTCPGVTRS